MYKDVYNLETRRGKTCTVKVSLIKKSILDVHDGKHLFSYVLICFVFMNYASFSVEIFSAEKVVTSLGLHHLVHR